MLFDELHKNIRDDLKPKLKWLEFYLDKSLWVASNKNEIKNLNKFKSNLDAIKRLETMEFFPVNLLDNSYNNYKKSVSIATQINLLINRDPIILELFQTSTKILSWVFFSNNNPPTGLLEYLEDPIHKLNVALDYTLNKCSSLLTAPENLYNFMTNQIDEISLLIQEINSLINIMDMNTKNLLKPVNDFFDVIFEAMELLGECWSLPNLTNSLKDDLLIFAKQLVTSTTKNEKLYRKGVSLQIAIQTLNKQDLSRGNIQEILNNILDVILVEIEFSERLIKIKKNLIESNTLEAFVS